MKVFKFGGASVKDAEGVRNVLNILEKTGHKNLLIVVSAMGKTTNVLEKVVSDYLTEQKIPESLERVRQFHREIIAQLFGSSATSIHDKINAFFDELENFMLHNKSTGYDYVYDQIVSYGEFFSSIILSEYLNFSGIKNTWIDAREQIITDSTYRDAQVHWEETQEAVQHNIHLEKTYITQGFIGADLNNFTTTLGREGSDYSAAIFAYCLNAESVSIWKDVPGILNADPKVFDNTRLLEQISYEEAVELAFYGASVIHPKTLQPLQQKEIPLFVRPFNNPTASGTTVSFGHKIQPSIPCYILKKKQVLISLSSLNFSFMVEENISEIFRLFHQYRIKVNLIQNSAISFSVCIDDSFYQLDKLIQHLKARYKVDFTTGVSLYTIRHFTGDSIGLFEKDRKILLKQVTGDTVQMVTRN